MFAGALRQLGRRMDRLGVAIQGDLAFVERLVPSTQVVKVAGHMPSVGGTSFVAPNATLAGRVELSDDASVWYGAELKADVGPITVGRRCNVQDRAFLRASKPNRPVTLGDNVTIGAGATVESSELRGNCLVGMGALVQEGCVMEENSMLAPGAVLPPGTHVKKGELWSGSPAQYLRDLTSEEVTMIRESAEDMLQLSRVHMTECDKPMETVALEALEAEAQELVDPDYHPHPNPIEQAPLHRTGQVYRRKD